MAKATEEERAERRARRDRATHIPRRVADKPRYNDYCDEDRATGAEKFIEKVLSKLADPVNDYVKLDLRDRWYISALIVRERIRRVRLRNDHQEGKIKLPKVFNLEDL